MSRPNLRIKPILKTTPQWVVFVILVSAALGCQTVGPDFAGVPAPLMQPDFRAAPSMLDTPNPIPSSDPLSFWSSFSDPILDQLVAQSLEQNLTVREAAERIIEARANLQLNGARLLPDVDSMNEYSFMKQSRNARPFVGSNGNSFNLFTSGFDSAWEIDFFGRIRRSIEAAEAELETQHATLADVQQTLTADVASSYFSIRLLQEQIAILDSSIELQNKTVALVNDRTGAGISTELDREQTLAFLYRSTAQKANLQQQLSLAFNRLSLLLGESSSDALRVFIGIRNVPAPSLSPDVGIPADLLRRRPDVRIAEAEVHAATARIGIAKADLYPSLTLLGSISLSGKSVSQMFQTDSLAFDIGPSIRWNILHFGRICDNIEIQESRLRQIIAQYQQAVLVAVKEVEDGLVKYQGFQTQMMSLDQARLADVKSVSLSLERYRAGKANFQRVLDTQLQLLQDSQAVAATRANSLIELVRLYKATGGGWPGRTSDPSEFFSTPQPHSFVNFENEPVTAGSSRAETNPDQFILEAGQRREEGKDITPNRTVPQVDKTTEESDPRNDASQWNSFPNDIIIDGIGQHSQRSPRSTPHSPVANPTHRIFQQAGTRNRYPLGQGTNAIIPSTSLQADRSALGQSHPVAVESKNKSVTSLANSHTSPSSDKTSKVIQASGVSLDTETKEENSKPSEAPPSIWESQPLPTSKQ